MARRTLYGGLWKSFLVICELVNDLVAQANTQEATEGANQVLRSSAAAAGLDAELTADHANSVTFDTEVKADFGTVVTWQTEVDADEDVMNDILHYMTRRDGVIGGNHEITFGTTDTTMIRSNGTAHYVIDGVKYTAVDQEVELSGVADVDQTKFGAWRIMGTKLGTITTQRATAANADNAMVYASAEIAMLCLSQLPRTAATVDLGFLVIEAASGGFTPATDLPKTADAQVTAASYYTCHAPFLDNGLTAAPSVGLSEGTSDDEYAFGTINARTNGKNVAQIAADVTQAWAQADVITTSGKYGGHLLVTDLAGTGIISLSQTGIAGSAQTVDSASLAAVNTALDAVQLALPSVFTVIGREVTLANKATFTYNTDDLAGTDGTTVWTDAVATAFNRTVTSGALVGPLPPTIPASITAPVNAAMTASPNSTLTAQALNSNGRVGVGMTVDANAQDVQFNNAIWYQIAGQIYFKDVDAAVDISVECAGAADTIVQAKAGAMWMFVAADGSVDGETDKAAQDYASAVLALAQYSIASNTLPVAGHVCVGVIQVTEGNSGVWTWGTDSITGETETYYSFEGLPGIETELASFALDAGAATFTYGTVTLVLGTGTRVAATGKANVVLNDATTTALGYTAAYLLYVLADDTEACVLVGSTYANVQAAKDAVRDLAPNPLMPIVGAIYVTARKIPFIAATTAFDVEGIDTEFVTYGVGANRQEHGRANGSTFTPVDDVVFAATGRP